MDESGHPADSHKVARVPSTSVADTFESGGVNEAVALINGVTQDWIVASALRAVRNDVHEVEMFEGMRVASDYVGQRMSTR